jgi:hypothetical protein
MTPGCSGPALEVQIVGEFPLKSKIWRPKPKYLVKIRRLRRLFSLGACVNFTRCTRLPPALRLFNFFTFATKIIEKTRLSIGNYENL